MQFWQWATLVDAASGRRRGGVLTFVIIVVAIIALLDFVILPVGAALHLLHPPPGWHSVYEHAGADHVR
jgi:hypothetical protein